MDCRPTSSLGQWSEGNEARAAGRDVVDFGFGNPDLPSPEVAVAKLAEAVHNPKNHRYSASRGIPNLRLAMANRYKLLFDVEHRSRDRGSHHHWGQGRPDPFDVGAARPGDTAIVPKSSYPIHLAGPGFRGARGNRRPTIPRSGHERRRPGRGRSSTVSLTRGRRREVKPRVIICSFPHNPTSACVDLSFMERLVGFALEHEMDLSRLRLRGPRL